uniref:Uncharacterized protein n=1 Tax=Hyaloperonospora arabidopsidis (strain Emoy2) TaxID=559515 RepID=M4BFH2_HYAAE
MAQERCQRVFVSSATPVNVDNSNLSIPTIKYTIMNPFYLFDSHFTNLKAYQC